MTIYHPKQTLEECNQKKSGAYKSEQYRSYITAQNIENLLEKY